MKKTMILSQAQLDEIVGTNTSYLDSSEDDIREFPNNEIGDGSKMEKKYGKPISTDDITTTLSDKNNSLWKVGGGDSSRGAIVSLNCSKKKVKISESNSELEGRFFKIGPTTLKKLKEIYNEMDIPQDSPGRITLSNVIERGGVTYTDATTIKSRMDKLPQDSTEYISMGGKHLHNFLNMTLSNSREMISRSKENLKNLGFSNVYQKEKKRNNAFVGKAHTPKNGNIIMK